MTGQFSSITQADVDRFKIFVENDKERISGLPKKELKKELKTRGFKTVFDKSGEPFVTVAPVSKQIAQKRREHLKKQGYLD